ncbi:MAG: wax ester/triacylglycerol synthase family O-acyltransferase [Acidimicrobiales bacterium]
MNGMDAAFLYIETPTMHMHVVGVVIMDPTGLDGPFGTEQIVAALAERIHLIPALRHRALASPGGIDHPVWIEDPDFDLTRHVARAPLGARVTWEALEDFVGLVAGRPLDRSRPLWEMWVVEGVEGGPLSAGRGSDQPGNGGPGTGGPGTGSVALVTKLHHSIMDGAAGGELMASLFDLTPDAPAVPPPPTPWVPDAVPSAPALAAASVRSLLARQKEVPAAVSHTLGGLVETTRTWAAQRRSGKGVPLLAPRTSLNGALSARRSVSLVSVDLDHVREIRTAFGTTVNDVVLAATATAVRRYLSATPAGLPPGPLVVAVPVDARRGASGADPGSGGGSGPPVGNHVSNMMVALPLQPQDPVARLREIHANAVASKALQSAFGTRSLQELTGIAAPPVMTAGARLFSGLKLARFLPPAANLIISNIPGPPIDLYCAGARLTGIFPMGPVMEGMGMNVTVLSEAHRLDVGVMACPELVPDVAQVGRFFVEAVTELRRLASPPH